MEKLTQEELEIIETLLQRMMVRRLANDYLDVEELRLRPQAIESAYRKVQRMQTERE